jgi:predicted nucleic acid-binding protein
VAREYEALLVHFPNLTLADVTRDVARRAAQLRARYRVRPADALQAATALVHGATAFVTNDRRLVRLEPVLDVIVLEDFST